MSLLREELDKPFPGTMATKTENTGIPFEDAGIFLSGGS